MHTPFIQGFGISAGLIIAIGAQNAYLLTQSVKRNHHLTVAMICIFCDALFISLGIAGLGTVLVQDPDLVEIATWGGAAYLFWYGIGSFRSAFCGAAMEGGRSVQRTLRSAVLTTLAVTLFNPHFYLDTVILLGSLSSSYEGTGRFLFGAGAVTGSTVWFLCLAFLGPRLAPVFSKPLAWKILDGIIGCVMWSIAASLVMRAIRGT